MPTYIRTSKLNQDTITFNQEIVNPKFFELAKELGYMIRLTGKTVLTHEIECNEADFKALIQMAKED